METGKTPKMGDIAGDRNLFRDGSRRMIQHTTFTNQTSQGFMAGTYSP